MIEDVAVEIVGKWVGVEGMTRGGYRGIMLGLAAFASLAVGAMGAEVSAAPDGGTVRTGAPDMGVNMAKVLPNQWVMVDAGGFGKRSSSGLVYLPDENAFVILGGVMGKGGPYSELTLNLAKKRWENRFPAGMEGVWGDIIGPSTEPVSGKHAFSTDGGFTHPNLGYGYNHKLEIWGGAAYDSARGKVVVPFHRLGQTWEYDPKARNWSHIATADGAPYTFWDDLVFNAMSYDPVNKEVLAGQNRWVLRNGRWVELELGSARVSGLRHKAERLAREFRGVVAACRGRFNGAESADRAAVKLVELAEAQHGLITALSVELGAAFAGATGYEKTQLGWARGNLRAALEKFVAGRETLAGRVTADAIGVAEDIWELLAEAAENLEVAPPKRAYFRAAVDERSGKMLVFGGHRFDRLVADTWVYDCASRSWERRRPKVTPAPRYGHGLVWLPESGKFLLSDGVGFAETWVYDLTSDEWSLLTEGGAARSESLTSLVSTWGWQPEMSAAGAGDVVVTLSNRNESKVPRYSTWIALVDAQRVDAEGTVTKGVPDGTESFVGGRTADPRWYDKQAGTPDTASQQIWLENLKPNVWTSIDAKTQPTNPRDNRAWGTTVLDPERDQLLQWGGGHVAYVGNNLLHYSLRTGRYFIGHRTEQSLKYAHGQGGMKMTRSPRGRGFMTGHSYHSYGYDKVNGKIVICGQITGDNTVHANQYYAYDLDTQEWDEQPIEAPFAVSYGYDRLCAVPDGLVAWASRGMWRLNLPERRWDPLPLSGVKLPAPSHEGHGVVYDSKRDRLIMFAQKGKGAGVVYDMKSGEARVLSPKVGRPEAFDEVRFRESVYVPELDALLMCSRIEVDGEWRWPMYDCVANEWKSLRLDGESPTGKRGYSVSTGMSYDPKRKLLWTMGAYGTVAALRLDLATADPRPL